MKTYTWLHASVQNPTPQVASDCNAIIFYNAGQTNVVVSGFTLLPGQSVTLDGHAGETDRSLYPISWAPAGGTLSVWRKKYA